MCSTELSSFFKNVLGIFAGDKIKNKTVIPSQILSEQKLAVACLRGLIDTDGTVSKRGSYLCISFSSHNPNLLKQVWFLGKRMNVFTHGGSKQTGTNSWAHIIEYFKLVGSSNLRHIIRFNEKFKTGKLLYQKETLKYLTRYQNLKLPCYGPVV